MLGNGDRAPARKLDLEAPFSLRYRAAVVRREQRLQHKGKCPQQRLLSRDCHAVASERTSATSPAVPSTRHTVVK